MYINLPNERTPSQKIDALPREYQRWCNATICGCMGCAKCAGVSKSEFDEWKKSNSEYVFQPEEMSDEQYDLLKQVVGKIFKIDDTK